MHGSVKTMKTKTKTIGMVKMRRWLTAAAVGALVSAPGAEAAQVEQVALTAPPTPSATGPATAARVARAESRVPEAWLPQDAADALYRSAREALNRGRYAEAAASFARIREDFPRSGYVPDSFYFQALALQRAGGTDRLREARQLLATQEREHADAASREDARSLALRIEGTLARGGDATYAVRIAEQAAQVGCEDGESGMRSAALNALLQMDAERAVPILEEVLQSRDACAAELRKRAVFLLSQKMTDRTVELFLDLAHRNPDPDPEVREAAVFWLSQVRSEEAVEALASILEDPDADPRVQEKAIFALSQHQSERAVQAMRRYAERADAPREYREKAIFWIGQNDRLGGSQYLRELYPSLGDDEELKKKVVFGVAQTPEAEDRAWLLARVRDGAESVEVRKNALFWAGQSGEVPVDDLMTLYRSLEGREIREQVIFALSQRSGDGAAVEALMEIAEDEDDPELREKAVFWLGQSDDERVAEFLLRLIRGNDA